MVFAVLYINIQLFYHCRIFINMWANILRRKTFSCITPFTRTKCKNKAKLCFFNYYPYLNLSKTLCISPVYKFSSNLNSDKQTKSSPQSKSGGLTFLEKIVNSCHPGFQPYLRLIRFDKPTGEYASYL